MNKKNTLISLLKGACFVAAFLIVPLLLQAQEELQVKRGERPEIPSKYITNDAIRPGYFRIKMEASFSEQMSDQHFAESVRKNRLTGIPGLDELNAKHNIKSVRQSFSSASGGIDQRYTARHQEWGFHLWLTIETGKSEDILSMVKEYQQLKEVSWAEPVYQIEWTGADPELEAALFLQAQRAPEHTKSLEIPNDPRFEDQWHYHNTGQTGGTPGADISLLEAWEITRGHPDVIVAVIDGGIHIDHPDLIDNMWEGIGYNFVSDTSLIFMTRHGTHVGGTIGAQNNNNTGVSGVAGGWGEQPGVKLMTCQVFEPVTMGENVDAFHLAPVWAADQGAVISQNSWGYTRPNVYAQIELDAIDYFNTHGGGKVARGGITISSAGNSNSSEMYYPSSYSEVISVAATNHKDQKADYSNYGGHIDISAPGGESPSGFANQGVLSTVEYNYGYASGTSMACPHVSGVVALMLSAAPFEFRATQLRQMIKSSVDDHYMENPDYFLELGTGRLNAKKAIDIALAGKRAPINFEARQQGNVHALLSWEMNQYDDPVILAVNTEPTFGIPSYNMQAGSRISGGGTVIYAGKGNSFIHDMPPASRVYYSIWSADPVKRTVSFERNTLVAKDAEAINIPHEELFQYPSLPAGWIAGALNQGSGTTGKDPVISLERYSDHPAAFPSQGNFMVKFNAYEARQGTQSQLTSPAFSTIGLSGLSFSFDWHYDTIRPHINDRMQISLSRNLENWTNIGSLTRAGNERGWKEETFSIPSFFNNREEVYIRFVFISDRRAQEAGGNMYLDAFNLNIAGEEIIAEFTTSRTEISTGDKVYFYNKSTGNNISGLLWDFGEAALPRTATGKGPHAVRYSSSGAKSPALTLNGNIKTEKTELIRVNDSALPAPTDLTGSQTGGSDIRLDWTYQTGKTQEGALSTHDEEPAILMGFNVYRNGRFYENIINPEARSFIDLNTPNTSLSYYVTAFYGSVENESAPSREIRMAINGLPVTLSITGNGETYPGTGTHYYPANDTIRIMAFPGANQSLASWRINNQTYPASNPLEWVLREDADITAVFDVPTNIRAMQEADNSLKIFPNPASSELSIEWFHTDKDILLQIVDMQGRVVISRNLSANGSIIKEKISLENVPSGVYLIRLSDAELLLTRKLIIQ